MENNGNLHPRVNREISYNSSPTLASFALPDVGHKVPASVATDVQTQEDEISSNLSELISNLPSKVYENCQRTARVIMLSELEKTVMKSKKLKLELSKKLQEFLPHKRDSDSTGEYTGKTKYFKSLHYSRVRIGQRNFINNILLNPIFKEKFQEIFKEQVYENCEKARKNENSQVSFEKRKQIIMAVINQYQNKFFNFYKGQKKQMTEEIKEDIVVKQEQEVPEQQQGFMTQILIGEEHQSMCMFIVPIVPIPLHPPEYEYYQRSRMMNF